MVWPVEIVIEWVMAPPSDHDAKLYDVVPLQMLAGAPTVCRKPTMVSSVNGEGWLMPSTTNVTGTVAVRLTATFCGRMVIVCVPVRPVESVAVSVARYPVAPSNVWPDAGIVRVIDEPVPVVAG